MKYLKTYEDSSVNGSFVKIANSITKLTNVTDWVKSRELWISIKGYPVSEDKNIDPKIIQVALEELIEIMKRGTFRNNLTLNDIYDELISNNETFDKILTPIKDKVRNINISDEKIKEWLLFAINILKKYNV